MKKGIMCLGMILFLCAVVFIAEAYGVLPGPNGDGSKIPGNDISHWAAPDTEYLEYYELGEFETNLPIVYLNTEGQYVSRENKIWATVAVNEAEEDGALRSVMTEPDYEAAILINYRGASSYNHFDKSQYRIKFMEEEGSTDAMEHPFLGMGQHSEWVLHGPFLDKTLLRNRLVYHVGKEIFEWAPDCRYVELFVDGDYMGVYLATEPVTNGESRLRLSEFGLLSGETAYIVKRDRVNTEANPLYVYGYYGGKTNNSLYIEYPTASHLTEAQEEWIAQDIDRFERVLYGENFADPELGYANYINMENFADYFILNEVFMNNDAGNLSTYIYKELGGTYKMAIWDYNNCNDNYQWFAQNYEEFFLIDNAWFSQLLKDRAFVDCVVERYALLRQGVLSEEYLWEQMECCQEELGPAIERNFAVWGYTFYDDMVFGENELHYNPTNYEEATEQFQNSLHARFVFMDEHITDLYNGCVN